MPLLADRVQETTTTSGTGTLSLAGAVTGYRSFNSSFTNGDVVFYTIDDTLGNWEVGFGTVGTGTLTRTTVIVSSNANNLVSFGSGSKRVFCSAPTRTLLPNQTGNSGKILSTDGTSPSWIDNTVGTVTSVSGTGTVNGLTLSGTVTSSGSLTLGGTLSGIANSALTNSSITFGSTSVSLGGTVSGFNGVSIGASSASTGAFTTLSASSTVSGTGFSTYLASPPAIGGTAPAAGSFTTLSASSTVSGTGFSTYLASPPAIGGTAPAAGSFTTLSASSTVSGTGFSTYLASPPAIGGTAPAAGSFTTLGATGNLNFTGTGNRITGDFSNATLANRVMFQNSAANSTTNVGLIPSGTGVASVLDLHNSSDPTNAAKARVAADNTGVFFGSEINGTGTYLPIILRTGGSERVNIGTTGTVLLRQSSNSANTSVSFDTTVQNALTLDSSGNFLVGTTTATSLITGAKNVSTGVDILAIRNENTAANTTKYVGIRLLGRDTVSSVKDGAYIRCYPNDQDWVGGNLTFWTRGSDTLAERARITAAGDVLVTGGGSLGYGTGSGGSVTQATNKNTAVTLNKSCGYIITANSTLATGATAGFVLNNTKITRYDTIIVNVDGNSTSSPASYQVWGLVVVNAAYIYLKNIGPTDLTEAVAISFAVIKSVTS